MISGFQLRAALITSKEEDQKVAYDIGVKPNSIQRLRKCKNLDPLPCTKKTNDRLVNYFNSKYIFFPEENSIEYRHPDIILPEEGMCLNRFQFTVARVSALLKQSELGVLLGVSNETVSRMEKNLNHQRLKCRKFDTLQIRNFFEKIGVVFEKHNKISLTQDPSIFLKKMIDQLNKNR